MPEFSVQKVQKHERGGGGEKQNKTKKQTNKQKPPKIQTVQLLGNKSA